jgi:hypothetical protein
MANKQSSSASYYEIVQYNSKTNKDVKVLPGQIRGLAEVNQKINALNAQLKTSREDEGGTIMYFRRKVKI